MTARRITNRRGWPARRPAERARVGADGRTRSRSSTALAPRISRSSKCRRSSARDGYPRWLMPPRCSPASRAPPPSVTRPSYPISRASIARSPPASPKLPCSPRPRKPSAARTINQSIDESLATYAQVCDRARTAGLRVRGYLSTAFGCPFEGAVAPDRVADVAARLADLGVFEVAISDTIGIAPSRSGATRARRRPGARARRSGRAALSRHARHGARERLASLPYGIATFDASAGGLGGCPYAPGRRRQPGHRRSDLHAGWVGIGTGVSLAGVTDGRPSSLRRSITASVALMRKRRQRREV